MIGSRRHLEQVMDERDRRYTELNDSRDKALEAARLAANKALDAALAAQNQRLGGLNELRDMVTDILSAQMPRAEAMVLIDQIIKEQRIINARLDKAEGNSATRAAIIAGVVAVAGLIGLAARFVGV